MRRRILDLAVVLSLLALAAGCGLIRIPRARHFPGPVAGFRVVDAATGADVPDAAVTFALRPWENWRASTGPHLSAGEPPPPAPRRPATRLRVGRGDDGVWRVGRTRRTAYLIPWGLAIPLGMVIYKDYSVTVTARAPGYAPLVLDYHAADPPKPGSTVQGEDHQRVPIPFDEWGNVVLRLPRPEDVPRRGRGDAIMLLRGEDGKPTRLTRRAWLKCRLARTRASGVARSG